MNRYSLMYLMENDMGDESTPARLRITKNVVVTPQGDSTIQDLVNALENPNNYGMYLSSLLHANKNIKDKVAAYFGTPNQRIHSTRPEKTAANISAYIADLLNTDPDLNRLAPVMLSKITGYKVTGNELQATSTPKITKDYIEKVFTTVFNNAGVTYNLTK